MSSQEHAAFSEITGQGVSSSPLQEAFSWSKEFFDLSHDEKMKALHPASSLPHRGYSPPNLKPNLEKAKLRQEKESVDKEENL